MPSYIRPLALDEALKALQAGPLTIIAGATDYYPSHIGQPLDDDVLDITAVRELRTIETGDNGVHIGALATWTDLLNADLPPWFKGLKQCARELGAVQTQNAGTVVGNVCNASPAADGIPCLMSLNASVTLGAADGARTMAVDEFVTGRREIALRPGEMVTGLEIPTPAHLARSVFLKLGARRYMVISIVNVAAVIEIEGDTVAAARIVVGACSPVANRLTALEQALAGQKPLPALADMAMPEHLSGLDPVSDMRGTNDYRMDTALTLVRRALAVLGG